MTSPEDRLNLLEELPNTATPVGLYTSCVVSNGFVHVSGHPCADKDGNWIRGKVGRDIDEEAARQAARRTALSILATLKHNLGSLNKVGRLVKSLGMVNAVPNFTRQPYVIDGYAQVMKLVFGDVNGIGARSAVGFGSLPGGIPVEIEAIFELAPGVSARSISPIAEPKIALPEPPSPAGMYKLSVISGNFLYLSGFGPQDEDGKYITGRVGVDLSLEQGQYAARRCGLSMIAEVKRALGGSLSRVKRVVKSLGMVNADGDFGEQPKVINGYSELMREVFGQEAGVAARSAIGMSSLPFNIAVEIEVILEIDPPPQDLQVVQVSPEERVRDLDINLPEVFVPKAMYKTAIVSNGYVYVSGHGTPAKGKLGENYSVEDGANQSRIAAIRVLALLKETLGSLDRVSKIVKLYGMVNAHPDFKEHPKVIDGFSGVMKDVFGDENGVCARSAVGLGSLPGGMPIEIEAIFELKSDTKSKL